MRARVADCTRSTAASAVRPVAPARRRLCDQRGPLANTAGASAPPRGEIPDRAVAQIHAEVAKGALEDAGLEFKDVDAYFCAGDAPGFGGVSMAEYLGLKLAHTDSTETGGSSYGAPVRHRPPAQARGAAQAPPSPPAGRAANGRAATAS